MYKESRVTKYVPGSLRQAGTKSAEEALLVEHEHVKVGVAMSMAS